MLKNFFFFFAVVGLATISGQAQELTAPQKPATSVEAAQSKVLLREQQKQTNAMILKQPITYSGFLVDVSKAEKPSKLLSLRQPANPAKDLQNVYYEPRSNKPKGFVLFALNF